MPGCQCLRPVTIVGFRLLQARTAHVSPCTQSLVLLMKLYLLACLLAIASSAALESATKPTKKAAPKVDPVPLSTADTASEATHSRATHSHHHQDQHTTAITTPRPLPLPSILLLTLLLLSALSSPCLVVLPPPTHRSTLP